jgi:hypothetical protein
MFLKILVTVLLVVVAWTAVVRLTGPRLSRRRGRRDIGRARDVPAATRCPRCGIYLPPGEACQCSDRA